MTFLVLKSLKGIYVMCCLRLLILVFFKSWLSNCRWFWEEADEGMIRQVVSQTDAAIINKCTTVHLYNLQYLMRFKWQCSYKCSNEGDDFIGTDLNIFNKKVSSALIHLCCFFAVTSLQTTIIVFETKTDRCA